VSVQKKDGR
jgi:hypothetical protein